MCVCLCLLVHIIKMRSQDSPLAAHNPASQSEESIHQHCIVNNSSPSTSKEYHRGYSMKPFPVQGQVCVDQYAVEYMVFDRVRGNRVDSVLIAT